MEQLGIFLAIITFLCWGLADLLIKISLGKVSKWELLFISQMAGAVLIFIVAFLLGQMENILKDGFSYLIFISIISVVGFVTFYEAMHKKGVALTSPIINMWAIVTVILGVIFYNEMPSALQWLAILLIVGGMLAISLKKESRLEFDRTFAYAIIAMVLWGVGFFLLRVPSEIFGAIMLTLSIKFFTGLFSVPVLIVKKVKLLGMKWAVFLLLVLIAVLETTGFLAYNFAISFTPVSIIAPIASAVPALSVVLGIFVLRERMSARQALGVVSAVIGIILLAL